MESITIDTQMDHNKTIWIGFRVTEELARNIDKLADIMENGKRAKFCRKTFKRMVENAKQKGLI